MYKVFKSLPVLEPSSKLVIIWETFQILTILIIFFWIPYIISFGITQDDQLIKNIYVKDIEVFFLAIIGADIIITLNIAYIDKGFIIKSRKAITINYIKGQAIVDILSFAFLLASFMIEEEDPLKQLAISILPSTIYYFLRTKKIRMIMFRLEEYFKIYGYLYDVIGLFKLLYTVVLIGHLFSCLWHGVAYYQIDYNYTWLHKSDIVNASNLTKYNFSYYWAVMTMITVGYGDIVPQNDIERLCANLTMFLACGVFAFSINSIGMMLDNLNSRKKEYRKSINLLNQFFTKNQVKFDLQSRIRSYLEYIWDVTHNPFIQYFIQQEEQEANDEEIQSLIDKLSRKLQQELQFDLRVNILKQSKVIMKFSNETIKKLTYVMEEFRFSPEEHLFTQDQIDDGSLYFVTKGEIMIKYDDNKIGRILQSYTKGNCFGEISFFTGCPRTASAISNGFSKVFKIKREDFLTILSQNHNDLVYNLTKLQFQENFGYIRDLVMLYNNYEYIGLQCYSCQKSNHMIKNCPAIHYVPNRERIIKKQLFPVVQERTRLPRQNTQFAHFATLLEMKAASQTIRDMLSTNLQIEDEYENVTIIDEPISQLRMIYEEDLDSYSQNSGSQEEAFKSQTQMIQEDLEDSAGPSINVQNFDGQRTPHLKGTITTAGFGFKEKPQEDQQQEISSISYQSQENLDSYQTKGQTRGEKKHPSLSVPTVQRIQKKKLSINQIQQIKEDSYNQNSYRSQSHANKRGRSPSRSKQEEVQPSQKSMEIPEKSYNPKRTNKRKKSSKTNRTRTCRTRANSMKFDSSYQVIQIPIENPKYSMELDNFEKLNLFTMYFPVNNYDMVIKRQLQLNYQQIWQDEQGNQILARKEKSHK